MTESSAGPCREFLRLAETAKPTTERSAGEGAGTGIEAVLLGTAQDGGLPQTGCRCSNCCRARTHPGLRQWVACLGLIDYESGQAWLVDATPDFQDQLDALLRLARNCSLGGILLTHAHAGHYVGLVHLGRECANTARMPVYASERMAEFLRGNAPWSQLVELQNVELRALVPGETVGLGPRLRVEPVPVPHREEYSDTLAFAVHGPARRLFYCPDVDSWQDWDRDARAFVASMDVALLDGTFYGSAELPGREMAEVAHPLVTDTVARLAGVPAEVVLIHLNHTNPLHGRGPERKWLEQQGMAVGSVGQRWRLG